MSKPLEHSQNNVKKYGGKVEDYLTIHTLLDSSKSAFADKRHRCLTHNIWFIHTILPKIFGEILTNSDGVAIATTQIGEDHVSEDFGEKFIPNVSDWLNELPVRAWMDNGKELPPRLNEYKKVDIRLENMYLDGASRYRPRPEVSLDELELIKNIQERQQKGRVENPVCPHSD